MNDLTKQVDILHREIGQHRSEIERLQGQLDQKDASLQQQVYSTALLIIRLTSEEEQNMDAIFTGDEHQNAIAQRENIGEVVRLIRFTYVQDPLVAPDAQNRAYIEHITPD